VPEVRQGRFAADVKEWCKKAGDNADQVMRAAVIGLLNNLIVRSPVGNPDLWQNPPPPGYVGGRFRANWQVTIAAAATGTIPAIDPSGQLPLIAATVTLSGAQCGPPIYIVNNLPYAIPLEYGWSTQAPQGMVRLAQIEFQKIVDDAVRALP
jgi:hypothetical protein